ncbi:hydroxyacid dehydrogenase [uncultured Roseobacter sp.]|uniref:hydroxyacid dehydrogenase n=1 Tax=uncultured Roseobacter sp. TaxID=114847 RepID=UPI00261B7D38|nr:hydroxyacid dehydrogenase [uncultured Roseobacter sp.]
MKPIVLSAPFPRTLDLIFSPEKLTQLHEAYEIIETTGDDLPGLPDQMLGQVRYIIGQPALDAGTLDRLVRLRAVLNVESNLIDNMPYARIFSRGIHVLTTGAVFAMPVAELGLGLALDLARGISGADQDFQRGQEKWGGDGNTDAVLLSGARVGIIGYGDLGRALRRLLTGFGCQIDVYDPWLPDRLLKADGVRPATLASVMSDAEFIFVVAAVTTENRHFIDRELLASMKPGARIILLSRAEVVDFDALIAAVEEGRIRAASDVFPEEPPAPDHPVRSLKGFLRSAHRAGAMDAAFFQMGEMVLEDMSLMDRGLPPLCCKRAEPETARRMQSRPVDQN